MTKISKEEFLQNAEILKTEIVKKKVQVNDLKQLTDLGIDETFIDVCLERGFISEQVTEIVKGFKPNGELYDYLCDCPKTNTSSAELCSTDILSDFIIPNVVSQGFPNHAKGTAYKYHLVHDLVEGKTNITTDTRNLGYQINWDEHTSKDGSWNQEEYLGQMVQSLF